MLNSLSLPSVTAIRFYMIILLDFGLLFLFLPEAYSIRAYLSRFPREFFNTFISKMGLFFFMPLDRVDFYLLSAIIYFELCNDLITFEVAPNLSLC